MYKRLSFYSVTLLFSTQRSHRHLSITCRTFSLVRDPDGPARVKHARAYLHDIFLVNLTWKGGKGGWRWTKKASWSRKSHWWWWTYTDKGRMRNNLEAIKSMVEEVDHLNGGGVQDWCEWRRPWRFGKMTNRREGRPSKSNLTITRVQVASPSKTEAGITCRQGDTTKNQF